MQAPHNNTLQECFIMALVHTTTVSQPICVSIQQIVADTTNICHIVMPPSVWVIRNSNVVLRITSGNTISTMQSNLSSFYSLCQTTREVSNCMRVAVRGELSIYLSACLPARQDAVTEDQRPSRHCLGSASLINIWRAIISWVIVNFYELMFCKQEKTNTKTGNDVRRGKRKMNSISSALGSIHTQRTHMQHTEKFVLLDEVVSELWRPSY